MSKKTESNKKPDAEQKPGAPDPFAGISAETPQLSPEQIAAARSAYPKLGETHDDTVSLEDMSPEDRAKVEQSRADAILKQELQAKEARLAAAASTELTPEELAKLNDAPDTDQAEAARRAREASFGVAAPVAQPTNSMATSIATPPRMAALYPPPPPQMTAENSGHARVPASPAPAADAPGQAAAQKKVRPLYPDRLTLCEHARQHFRVIPVSGTNFEDVLDPAFWSHIARNLKPGDIVEVWPEEMHYFAEVFVRAVSPQAVDVHPIRVVPFPRIERQVDQNFRIEFRGAIMKNCVVRNRDNVVVQQGFDTPDRAATWLALNQRSIAA